MCASVNHLFISARAAGHTMNTIFINEYEWMEQTDLHFTTIENREQHFVRRKLTQRQSISQVRMPRWRLTYFAVIVGIKWCLLSQGRKIVPASCVFLSRNAVRNECLNKSTNKKRRRRKKDMIREWCSNIFPRISGRTNNSEKHEKRQSEKN